MIKRANLLFGPFQALALVTCTIVGTSFAFAAADFPPGAYAVEEYAIVLADKRTVPCEQRRRGVSRRRVQGQR